MDETIGKGVVQVLECVLESLVKRYDKTTPTHAYLTKFHAIKPPNISLRDYLERIRKYGRLSVECFVLSLIYIDRLIRNVNLIVNSYSVHRVVITSVMLAAKFFDDRYCSNAFYAQIGGVTVDEINSLEIEYLFYINFYLYVDSDEYMKYHNMLYLHTIQKTCLNCCTIRFPNMIIIKNEKGENIYKYEDMYQENFYYSHSHNNNNTNTNNNNTITNNNTMNSNNNMNNNNMMVPSHRSSSVSSNISMNSQSASSINMMTTRSSSIPQQLTNTMMNTNTSNYVLPQQQIPHNMMVPIPVNIPSNLQVSVPVSIPVPIIQQPLQQSTYQTQTQQVMNQYDNRYYYSQQLYKQY